MASHAHIYGDPKCTCDRCGGSNPVYRPRLRPTPASQLLDISTRKISRSSCTIESARAIAQAEADKNGIAMAIGWTLNDTTGTKELGWCPAAIAPHNCFVIEVLEVIQPKECT